MRHKTKKIIIYLLLISFLIPAFIEIGRVIVYAAEGLPGSNTSTSPGGSGGSPPSTPPTPPGGGNPPPPPPPPPPDNNYPAPDPPDHDYPAPDPPDNDYYPPDPPDNDYYPPDPPDNDYYPPEPPEIPPQPPEEPTKEPPKESKKLIKNEKMGDYYGVPQDKTGRVYGDPKGLVAKSQFMMELLKTEQVIPGRLVLNASKYNRIDHEGVHKYIKTEPVETSPYQRYMGEMGIDTGQTDVIISHEVFGQVEVVSNNNVMELYLVRAYEKGFYNLTELNTEYGSQDGKDLYTYLKVFRSKEKSGTTDIIPRWDYFITPIKIGFKQVKVSDKVIESDNSEAKQYPEQYFTKWREVVEQQTEWAPRKDFVKGSRFWGNSFLYVPSDGATLEDRYKYSDNVSEEVMEDLDSWFSQESIFVIRRRPVIQDPDGYQYFNDESMTVLDAYKLTYKLLTNMEGEVALTEAETDYINSAYQMNMVNFLPDEVQVCKYLIAKGIIDGEDLNLYQAANLPLTNEVAIDLLYRVMNKGDRHKLIPHLNDVEAAMVKKGYSQVNISLNEQKSSIVPVHLGEPQLDENNENIPAPGYEDIKGSSENFAYSYIFVRMPKAQTGDEDEKIDFHLRINDEFRSPVKGFVFKEGDEPLLDAQGYEWRLYTVHKDTASDMILTGMSENTNRSYQIYGINGPGFYWLQDDDSEQRFTKWTLKEFLTKPSARAFLSNNPQTGEENDQLYEQMKNVLEFRTEQSSSGLEMKINPDSVLNEYDGPPLDDEEEKTEEGGDDKSEDEDNETKENEKQDKGSGSDAHFDILNRKVAKSDTKKEVKDLVLSAKPEKSLEKQLEESNVAKISEEEFKSMGLNSIDDLLAAVDLHNTLLEPYEGVQSLNEIDGTVWQRPLYAEPQGLKDIIYGPVTKDQLQALRYGTDNLVGATPNGFAIDKNNSLIKSQNSAERFSLEEVTRTRNGQEEIGYVIKFKPKTADYKNEMAKFMRHLSTGEEGQGKKFPGFAKLTDNQGKPLVLISKTQLGEFGIEAMSDKLLYNTKTGQRAYLNTEDHMTLIGNNITHYSDDEMIVNAFGAKGDHDDEGGAANKVFYNLNIILELLNDTKIVEKVAGKNIYQSKEEGSFEILKVINRETQTTFGGDELSVAKTYVYNTGDDRVYVNLSSMTGMTSNFIYYKNKKSDVNSVDALIVYHPRDEYIQYTGKTDNTLASQMMYGGDLDQFMKIKDVGDDIRDVGSQSPADVNLTPSMVRDRQTAEEVKAIILKKLFLGSTKEPGDVVGLDYTYDIYLLEKAKSSDGGKDTMASFISSIFGKENEKVYNAFNRITENPEELENSSSTTDNHYKDIKLGVIKAATSEAAGDRPNVIPIVPGELKLSNFENNFLVQESTGNLYFYVGDKRDGANTSRQQGAYQQIFGQNMYYSFDQKEPKLGFRMRHYYQNTPKDWIPLERYAENEGSFGSMFLSGGLQYYNFERPLEDGNPNKNMSEWKYSYKLPREFRHYGTQTVNNNVAIVTKTASNEAYVGLYTQLELPYVEIPISNYKKDKNNSVDGLKVIDFKEVSKGYTLEKQPYEERASDYSKRKHRPSKAPVITEAFMNSKAKVDGITDILFNHTLYQFDKELNKNRSQTEVVDEYRTFDVVATYANTMLSPDSTPSEYKRDLMSGTWDSLVDYNINTYNFSTNKLEDVGIDLESGSGYSKDKFIILLMGRNKKATALSGVPSGGGIYAIKLDKNDLKGSPLNHVTFDTNYFQGTSSSKAITNWGDLLDFATEGDTKIKVFMKPSLAIPQGTNLVDTNGRIRTLPSPIPRDEIPYAADIINSLLFRITLRNPKYDDKTFLYQIPEGSVVDFGNGDYFIKSSREQKDSDRLKWVTMINSPKSNATYESGAYVEDFTLMSRFLTTMGNRIKIGYNMGSNKIPLKSIIGKGMYVVPHVDILNEIVRKEVSIDGVSSNKAQLHFQNNENFWTRNTSGSDDKYAKIKNYDLSYSTYNNLNFSTNSAAARNLIAKVLMELYMPPTIEVQKIDDDTNEAHYKALMYYDVRGFQVDKDDSYVRYLQSKDTDAEDVLDDIVQLRTTNLDGMKYLNLASVRFTDTFVNSSRNFMLGVVPLLLVILILLINVVYVVLYFPGPREAFTEVSRRLGWGIADKLENGYLSPATLPHFADIAIVSIFLAIFTILFANGIVFTVFGKIFVFFQKLATGQYF